jgi:6-pyruvoyl-tetrahydropterin synthase
MEPFYPPLAALGKYFLRRGFPVLERCLMRDQSVLFLRDFTVLDCAVFTPSLGLRGESLYVSAELAGELDEHGFILDFGPAKKWLKRLVDETLDHKLLVPRAHSTCTQEGAKWTLRGAEESFGYTAPETALALIPAQEVTLAALEAFLALVADASKPANLKSVRFSLREDPRFLVEANFRYTHGLRYHEGNCQRLFHGHRNPVEVWRGPARVPELESILAEEWANAHFVEASTLLNRVDLDLPLDQRRPGHPGTGLVEYESAQGRFRGEIPASRLVVLNTEPSIENIARLGWERLRGAGESGPLRVVAYEGLNKGASFSSD